MNHTLVRLARMRSFIHVALAHTYLFVNCCLFLRVYWLLLLYFFSAAHTKTMQHAYYLLINDHIRTIKKYCCLSPFRKPNVFLLFFLAGGKKNHVDLSFAIYFGKSHDAHTFYIFLHWYIWNRSISVIQKCCIWSINTIFTSICKSFNGRLCLCGTL